MHICSIPNQNACLIVCNLPLYSLYKFAPVSNTYIEVIKLITF